MSHSGNSGGIGWVAAGDADDAWLLADEPQCPEPPIELSDVSYQALGRFEAIACLGGQQLTLRGWIPECEPVGSDCIYSLRPQRSGYYGGSEGLAVQPAPGVVMPERSQWIEVTGMFDHPSADSCGTSGNLLTSEAEHMQCRFEFVVISARPVEG